MKWIRVKLETTTEAIDYFGAIADDLGLEGFEIEDNVPISEEDKKRMFIDILPELPPDEGIAKVSFYVNPEEDVAALVEKIKEETLIYAEVCDFGTLRYEVSATEDKDWINNWKEFFKPFRIDDRIVIKPTWEELKDRKPGDIVIEIDPGTAFGTGAHETTKLCILNLEKYLKKGDRLLDVGCGSGILSIAGMLLGAKDATGIDIDENAARISCENAEVNRIPFRYFEEEDKAAAAEDGRALEPVPSGIGFMSGNVIDDGALRAFIGRGSYEVVVANILADIIIPLSAVAAEFMREDAVFISSGIIYSKEQEVRDALEKNGFEVIEALHMKDWVSLVAKVRA